MKKTGTEEAQVEQRLCSCGCKETPRSKNSLWMQGHDARYKQKLIRRFDDGNAEAGQELIERGWTSQDVLDLRRNKVSTSLQVKRDRLRAKLERLNGQIAKLEDQRASVQVQLVGAERLV